MLLSINTILPTEFHRFLFLGNSLLVISYLTILEIFEDRLKSDDKTIRDGFHHLGFMDNSWIVKTINHVKLYSPILIILAAVMTATVYYHFAITGK